jgi:hypothetical protein
MPEIDFDLTGARKAGAKPSDLSNYFKSNFNLDFDFDGAYKSGASDDQIMSYLNQNYLDVKKKDQTGVTSGKASVPIPSKLPSKGVLEQGLEFAQKGYKMPISEALAEDINKKEDTGAALYNTLVGSATRLAGGLDYLVKSNIKVPEQLPKELLKTRPELAGKRLETANESRKRIESFVEQARSEKSSREYESKLG